METKNFRIEAVGNIHRRSLSDSTRERTEVRYGPWPEKALGVVPFGSDVMNAAMVEQVAVPTISHYRVNTGRITVNTRAEVEDDGIAVLEPMLSPGVHKVPNTEGYTVETRIVGTMLSATVGSGRGPLFRMSVVLDGRDLARVVPSPRVADVPIPVCVVEIVKDLPYDPVVSWLHSLVCTLAWAWVRHATGVGATVR